MKATLFLSALVSTTALAGVIRPRQDEEMTANSGQPASQNPGGKGGNGGAKSNGGASFKFAPACKASGSATPNPQDPFAKALMAYHNVHRTYHGACSLSWDPTLAKQAQAAADTCKFQHQMIGNNGQNIAEQSGSGNIAAGTVSMWYEEGAKTNYQGGSMQQGHYTQMLWKGTSALGCGIKNCGSMTLVFCDYAPAGNVMGEFKQNVGSREGSVRPICAEQQAMSQYANSDGSKGGGSGGASGKCITDQELGLPTGAGGAKGGGGGQGGAAEKDTGTGGGNTMKTSKGGMKFDSTDKSGGGSQFMQLMQGGSGSATTNGDEGGGGSGDLFTSLLDDSSGPGSEHSDPGSPGDPGGP